MQGSRPYGHTAGAHHNTHSLHTLARACTRALAICIVRTARTAIARCCLPPCPHVSPEQVWGPQPRRGQIVLARAHATLHIALPVLLLLLLGGDSTYPPPCVRWVHGTGHAPSHPRASSRTPAPPSLYPPTLARPGPRPPPFPLLTLCSLAAPPGGSAGAPNLLPYSPGGGGDAEAVAWDDGSRPTGLLGHHPRPSRSKRGSLLSRVALGKEASRRPSTSAQPASAARRAKVSSAPEPGGIALQGETTPGATGATPQLDRHPLCRAKFGDCLSDHI